MKRFVFNKTNRFWLGIAIAVMIAGYADMAMGGKTISVILLFTSYIVLFPLSILIGWHKAKNEKN